MSMDFSYANLTLGREEPEEMWLTGNVAIEFITKLAKEEGKEPNLTDAHGDPIDPKRGYYISKETGLVLMI